MIALDTNIFIYWLERNPEFYDKSVELIKGVHAGSTKASCSVLVLTEIYNGSGQIVEAIAKLPNLSIQAVDKDIAELAGNLRLQHRLKTVDALHIASALCSGADEFITNDQTLVGLPISQLVIRTL